MEIERSEEKKQKLARYQGQLQLPGFSPLHQERLFSGMVLVLGAGTIACTIAMELARSGVGTIKLVSDSLTELSAARNFLSSLDCPDTELTFKLVSEPLLALLEREVREFDVIVDGLCDWQFKLLASDVAMRANRPLVHSYTSGLRCHVYCMVPGRSMCLRCLLTYLEMEDYPREAQRYSATLPALESIVGGFQGLEVVKLLSRLGVSQGNELFRFDGLSGEFEVLRGLDPSRDFCPDCSGR